MRSKRLRMLGTGAVAALVVLSGCSSDEGGGTTAAGGGTTAAGGGGLPNCKPLASPSASTTTTAAATEESTTSTSAATTGTAAGAPSIPAGATTLTYGADQELTGFNPNTSKDNGTSVVNVIIRMWPSAFLTTDKLKVVHDKDLLVEEPTVTTGTPQVVTYKINPKAVWSDGTPISVDDFRYNAEMQAGSGPIGGKKDVDGKEIDASSNTGYEDIQSIEGSDGGKTVKVTFKNKFSDYKSLFSYLIPAHIGKVKGWNTGFDSFDPKTIISGGPYIVANYKKGESLTLVANEKYWGTAPKVKVIVHRFLGTSGDQPKALKGNEVDVIYPQPQLDLVQEVKGITDVTNEVNFGLSFEHMDFNFKIDCLAELPVRKAIIQGTNRQDLVRRTVAQFSDKASVLNNRIFVNNQPEYKDTSGGTYAFDKAKAIATLEAAGYKKGSDGIYANDKHRLSMRWSTTKGNALREAQGEAFKAQMKDIGIDIRIDNPPSTELFGERLPQGNFDIANFAWVATPFPSSNKSIYVPKASGGGQNYGQYENPELVALFGQAGSELDESKKAELYNKIDEILWRDAVTMPLYQKPTFIAFRKGFTGITDNPSSNGPFWNAETWTKQ